MPRKPNPRALVAAFVLLSAALSAGLLAVRNLYDDEILSLDIVTSPVAKILQVSAEGDVHPPGMYLLAHLAYSLLPSFRWMNLFPGLVLYVGLVVFLLAVTPLFIRTRAQLCLLLLATMHPQLLMWSATYRWYAWWTGIALITLTVALQPREPLERRPALGAMRVIVVGVLLAALFYLNYITLLFAFALGAAMLLRYRAQPRRQMLLRALLIAGVFGVLIAPQIPTMIRVHLPAGRAQSYGLAVSTVRLLQSVAASEAFLPWHPMAVLAGLLFFALCIVGLIALLRLRDWRPPATEDESAIASIVLFGLLFFVLVAGSGLGGKPRNGLLLVPVLAPVGALIVSTLRPRAQVAILVFFALWSGVGTAHLFGRYGLTKATMNDRPEEVVAFIRQSSVPGCAVVVTDDSGLAFELAQAQLPRTLIVSPFRGATFGGARALPTSSLSDACAHPRLYTVRSYLGGEATRASRLNAELESSTLYIEGEPRVDSFGFDSDAARKRSLTQLSAFAGDLSSVERLPDYRYIVISGPMDGARLEAMRRGMPHFVSGYTLNSELSSNQPGAN